MSVRIPIKLPVTAAQPDGFEIEGMGPVIILGPNGAGKTRFSTKITGSPLARIPALRNLATISDIPFQPPKHALDQLTAQAQEQFNNIWQLANDAQFSLSAILANNAKASEEYCDAARLANGATKPPPDTQLTQLLNLWHGLFPGRQLMFEDHQPWVTNTTQQGSQRYRAQTMSDGERVALYVASRVLLAPSGIVVVDEPELHLHSLLARRLWTLLQAARPDCRFVYITHDLSFALSRREATYVLVRSQTDYQIASKREEIPDYIFRDTVGAATLAIAASKTVFCEGSPGKDDSLYDALLSRDGFQVVAVGSCANVEQCVEALRDERILRGSEAFGIVDRDFWFSDRLASLTAKGVQPLTVHEVEGLYVLQVCFDAVANQLKYSGALADTYAEFVAKARQQAQRDVVRVATERTKQRVYAELSRHLDKISPADLPTARTDLIGAFQTRIGAIDVGAVFDQESQAVQAAVTGPVDQLLAVFPAKALIGLVAQQLGVTRERYCELVDGLVRAADPASPLVKNLRAAVLPE